MQEIYSETYLKAKAPLTIFDTTDSVVRRVDATLVAFCNALLVTFAGSRMPAFTISVYSSFEGIVSGGGSAYIHASKEVAKMAASLEGDEKTGANIILKALESLRRLPVLQAFPEVFPCQSQTLSPQSEP